MHKIACTLQTVQRALTLTKDPIVLRAIEQEIARYQKHEAVMNR